MNKDETTKPKEKPFAKQVEAERKAEEAILAKPKEEITDREGPLVEKELPPNETVIKKVKPEEEKPLKERVKEAVDAAALDDPTIYARLVRMERMLEWLIVQRVTDDQKLIKQPNIADIFKEIALKMQDEKKAEVESKYKQTEEEKEDEVPSTT